MHAHDNLEDVRARNGVLQYGEYVLEDDGVDGPAMLQQVRDPLVLDGRQGVAQHHPRAVRAREICVHIYIFI